MKKRGAFSIFSIILLLILMPNAYSIYEELIYSGTVEDKDTVNISNSLFEFRIDSVSSKVYVEIDVSAVIIANGECKIKGNLNICIKNVSFSYRNYTAWYDVYQATVDVYHIKSTIDATQTIGQNNLLIDEQTTAELAIENTADVVAEDVTATIKIPASILVTEVEGCKKTHDSIIFNADVYPMQIRKCTYKIQGLTGADFELTANITYFDGIEEKSATSNSIIGKVYNNSLSISSKLNKTSFDIQEKLDLTIDIENINDAYDLRVTTLSIKLPEKLLLLKTPQGTNGNSRIISWSGTLAPKEKKSFIVEFQSLTTGNYSVLTEASYKISKFSRTAENTANIGVYCDCPYISHDFSQQIAVPDQRVTLKAFVINPSKIHNFRNVKVNYITNIPNIQDYSTAYASIRPFETIKIFDSPIITPPLNEIYHFNITVVYESAANQVFVVKDNIIIKVPGWEEKIPEKEEKIEFEEQGETKEQQEAEEQQKTEEVIPTQEKTEEVSEEKKKESSKEETPAATIIGKEKPIKAYTIIAYITALIFILVVIITFKRKKHEKAKEQENTNKKELKTEIDDKEKYNIKEFLSIIFRKKETMERNSEYKGEEEKTYKDIEKQIKKLGITSETEKQGKKLGLFRRIFKKK